MLVLLAKSVMYNTIFFLPDTDSDTWNLCIPDTKCWSVFRVLKKMCLLFTTIKLSICRILSPSFLCHFLSSSHFLTLSPYNTPSLFSFETHFSQLPLICSRLHFSFTIFTLVSFVLLLLRPHSSLHCSPQWFCPSSCSANHLPPLSLFLFFLTPPPFLCPHFSSLSSLSLHIHPCTPSHPFILSLFFFLQPPNRKTNGQMPRGWYIARFLPLHPPVPEGEGGEYAATCIRKSSQSQWSMVGWHHWLNFCALVLSDSVMADSAVIVSGFTALEWSFTVNS